MDEQVQAWKSNRLEDDMAKLLIYRAFVEGELHVSRHLMRSVHENYFHPRFDEFAPRTTWSLSNAFTSAFQNLDAIPQFRAAAKLGPFMESVVSQRSEEQSAFGHHRLGSVEEPSEVRDAA